MVYSESMAGTLIIRLKGLGDLVHLLPSLEKVVAKSHLGPFALLCQAPFGEIIPDELGIEILQIPPHASFTEMLEIIRAIRRRHFNRLFDLFVNPRTALISFLSGIPQRYAFEHRGRRYAYHETWAPPDPNKHLTDLFDDFFTHFGIEGNIGHPKPARDSKAAKKAEDLLKSMAPCKPLLGININSTFPTRSWPVEHFASLIRMWHEATGQRALLFWGPGEKQSVDNLLEQVGTELAFSHPPLSIREWVELLALPDLFISGDTGPMHLAWALKVPTVALFGPTTRRAVAPTGERHLVLYNHELDCLQCHREVCSDGRCMKDLTPTYVWTAIQNKYPELIRRQQH